MTQTTARLNEMPQPCARTTYRAQVLGGPSNKRHYFEFEAASLVEAVDIARDEISKGTIVIEDTDHRIGTIHVLGENEWWLSPV